MKETPEQYARIVQNLAVRLNLTALAQIVLS